MKRLIILISIALIALIVLTVSPHLRGQALPPVRSVVCADLGISGDAYICATTPAVTTYTNGMMVKLTVGTANTLGATLNLNGVGFTDIVKLRGGVSTVLATNDLVPKGTYILVYNSTDANFKVISAVGTASGGSNANTRIYLPVGWRDSELVANRLTWAATTNVTVDFLGSLPQVYMRLLFPDGQDSYAAHTITLPSNWTDATFSARLYWMADTASTNSVHWMVSTECVGPSEDPVGATFVFGNGTSTANTGNALLNITSFSTIYNGTCAADEMLWIRVGRDGDGTGGVDDSLAASAALLGVEITFSTTGS